MTLSIFLQGRRNGWPVVTRNVIDFDFLHQLKEFRFAGREVRTKRVGSTVALLPRATSARGALNY